nr:hypothetical protein CFP56_48430 [Quercus suber]
MHNIEVVKVAQLISSITSTWKAELIKETFLPYEADSILRIPLSPWLPEDSRVWAWSKYGLFTVSGYGVSLKLLKTSIPRTTGDSSDKAKAAQFWKGLWKIDCPNKIKHFLWRMCREILPINYRLAARKVSSNDRCGFCRECESSGHTL